MGTAIVCVGIFVASVAAWWLAEKLGLESEE
jgi:uncharacterized membrane protein YdjX (TVP38/TMEM64 family)